MKSRYLPAAIAALAMTALPASATTFVRSFEFTISTSGPISTQSGSFTYTYDDVTGAAALNAINFSIGATTFTAANAGIFKYPGPASDPILLLFGADFGLSIFTGTNDFWLYFSPSASVAPQFSYSTTGWDNVGTNAAISLRDTTNAVPEPATWSLMLGGFACLGFALRRRSWVSFALASSSGAGHCR